MTDLVDEITFSNKRLSIKMLVIKEDIEFRFFLILDNVASRVEVQRSILTSFVSRCNSLHSTLPVKRSNDGRSFIRSLFQERQRKIESRLKGWEAKKKLKTNIAPNARTGMPVYFCDFKRKIDCAEASASLVRWIPISILIAPRLLLVTFYSV